jgi:phosphoribosylaminoimidazole-succinocarboxamide synthase|tara:strand:- start:267 stop:485 length:219 start_codon:yes stop_codon:yes gene_type:complete
MINTQELMRFVKATILSDLYVELSREWEDEDTEYENPNFVRNIKQAKDVEELKEVLVKIVRKLNDYLEESRY